ncbi:MULTISPECIES: hypothetical protein [Streptococcus]|uniref:Uncharacterized protein n=3 Tax=Streptococcus sanguinis TaxID=1305 RepID=A0A2X3VWE2_STRSA|nr:MULTISPECIES: hypothetical protein [Streptococcus]EGJ45081.1 hypothetical protein HMPREF9396_0083 [Streptococcus sanguinis SK1059]EGQ24832.1 hypothetical protein HMPREF9387_0659 [Streptococcus sanguinis SK340]MBF1722317.1 hypothetical protein [Streptococcus sp.]QLB51802.1 hypothetical protein FFV08_03475 [Streptococcus sanguinis]WNU94258.1 hypothetical protein RSK81_09375 [Streptococcus sp. DTU_2020_1000888_1_SI_GRL_NUU_041A]
MKKLPYYQPDLQLLIHELKNCSRIIDEEHELYKFLITYFAASATENTGCLLPEKYRKFKRDSLQSRGMQLIGQILDELHFLDLDIPSTFTLTNSGIKQVIEYINEELDRKIQEELVLYRKESLLLNLTLLASVLSKITIYLNTDYKATVPDGIDELIVSFNSIKSYIFFDPRVFLGELKSTLEHILNRLLLTGEQEYRQNSRKVEINYTGLCSLFELFFAKILLDSYIDLLPFVNKDERDEISFSKEKGISLPNRILENFTNYIVDTRDEELIIGDKKIEVILKYLQQVKNISPNILNNYLSQPDENRALKLENIYLSLCEKNLIISDFSMNQSLSTDDSKLVIENLTLNNKSFYESMPINSIIGEPNMRLFRAPVLEFSEIDILPTFSFLESAKYFPYRILRSDILNKKNGKTWTTLIRKNFDERLLPEFKKIAESYDRDCKINYYLNQSKIDGIKALVKNNSLIEELDLVFIYNNTLYTYDLKNYGLARNVKQCKSIVNSQIYKEFAKLNKLKSTILSNKLLFQKEFGQFDTVEIGVVTVNTTPYKYFKNGRVYSIPELRKNPNLLIS